MPRVASRRSSRARRRSPSVVAVRAAASRAALTPVWERRARIPAGLHAAIVSEFGEAGEFIFTTEQGNPFRRQYITREIARAARRVLGARITAHDLRHSRGTDLYRASGRLVAVSRFLGHSGVEVTARYYTRDDFTVAELLDGI